MLPWQHECDFENQTKANKCRILLENQKKLFSSVLRKPFEKHHY